MHVTWEKGFNLINYEFHYIVLLAIYAVEIHQPMTRKKVIISNNVVTVLLIEYHDK